MVLSNVKVIRNKILVKFLQLYHGIEFPGRRLGNDEWVYQWRLDFLTNVLEKESIVWCKRLIRPGMVAVDVGAHIGYYTRLFSQLVGNSGHVFAFEPCSENFAVLSKNLNPKKFPNVHLYNKAVGAENRQGTLFISPGHSNHSLNQGYTKNMGQEQVEIVSLDSVLYQKGIERIDFVKIDVEGGEINVLRGMKETLKASPALSMLVEFNPAALQAGGWEPVELIHQLEDAGFHPKPILADSSLGESIDFSATVNLLCRRENV